MQATRVINLISSDTSAIGGMNISLSAVHLLLTYKCDSECDHCFVWSSPESRGTMSVDQIGNVLSQSRKISTVEWVFFEGGEPFLFYPVLVKGVEMARRRGFEVGVVTNAYWATDEKDSVTWLKPLSRLGISDLSISIDEYHDGPESQRYAKNARRAARRLDIPVSILRLRSVPPYPCNGRRYKDEGEIYFRGRAAANLAPKAEGKAWKSLNSCPEEPPDISRVHIDSFGNVQFCQGITLGNVWKRSIGDIMSEFDPDCHPLIGPLIRGGPISLAKELGIRPKRTYADECHMCYDIRCVLRRRGRFKSILTPDQAYGESSG